MKPNRSVALQRARGTLERNRRIAARIEAGETYQAVADDYGLSRQRIEQIARQYNIEKRGPGSPRGERNHRWGGGRTRTNGYVKVYAPNHPRASGLYVLEHILVAEAKIGRPLRADECVHHRNGVRDDNRPENLEVLTRSEHARLHNKRYSDALLVDLFRWMALKVNHTPRQRDITKQMPGSWGPFYHRFGSLTKCAHAAGLTPNSQGHHGHGGTPLPLNFRRQHKHLLQYRTPEDLASALHGGFATEHERHCNDAHAA
jgi:hypothetical protein